MANKLRVAKKAPLALVILWEDGFFRAWRKLEAVTAELAKREHHFTDATLGMALKSASHLTRKGKPGSFEYIQKYPSVRDDGKAAPKKGRKK
ncbi:MAG: hypothetical protein WAN23_18005 [Candidatus Acidiferrales bacterium]